MIRVANFFSCLLMLLCVLRSEFCDVLYDFSILNDIRFVFTSSCLYEGLIYVICVCLRLVVYNTYCIVWFFFLRLVYPIFVVSFNKIHRRAHARPGKSN